MAWLLDLAGQPRSHAIVRAICTACADVRVVQTPDLSELVGVVVCLAPSRDLEQALAAMAAANAHAIVVSNPASGLDPWRLLAAGAADLVMWDNNPEPIRARLARLHEVERLIESPAVRGVIIGWSPSLRQALRELVTAARFGTGPILLLGETGTGKELAARVAHSVSNASASGQLVVVDCTTIVPTLSGSELFGHERGAFTGAVTVRTGAVAAANAGTLMLDEVGELPLDLQPELLRLVQEGVYKRVGADSWLRTSFRLICATNRALDTEVAQGRFRADLFYRIAASSVTLPPLRDRVGDVIPLFKSFFAQAQKVPQSIELSAAVEAALVQREYPGNLRDLRQLAHRVAARHVGQGPVTPGDLPPADRPSPVAQGGPMAGEALPGGAIPGGEANPGEEARSRHNGAGELAGSVRTMLREGSTLKELREYIADVAVEAALEESGGNVRAAAAHLGVTDRALHQRRARHRNES